MDRRTFLKTTLSTTGVAATGVAASGAALADGEPVSANAAARPAIGTGAMVIEAQVEGVFAFPYLRDIADQFAWRVAEITDGRLKVNIGAVREGDRPEPVPGSGQAVFTTGDANVSQAPGFSYFGGLPVDLGLPVAHYLGWLSAGGGQMLWDELAAERGFKPLLVGHSATYAGAWYSAELNSLAGFQGVKVTLSGTAAVLARRLGADVLDITAGQLPQAVRSGSAVLAEVPVPYVIATTSGFSGGRGGWVGEGLAGQGRALALHLDRQLWDRLRPSDRAALEMCAGESVQRSLATQQILDAQVAPHVRLPSDQDRAGLPADVVMAAQRAAREFLREGLENDDGLRRIHDSYVAARQMLTGAGDPLDADTPNA
ncbi:MAG TPA: hypothetical protein VMX97_13505 [Hyphomicrobiaceae bacterium]|nr:hypothetical protein [Hyphomicrobiaceae bacterium]